MSKVASFCGAMMNLWRKAMAIIDQLILAAIVLAFAVFGLVLAWAERQTRHINTNRTVRKAGNNIQQNQPATIVRLNMTRATELLGS
jgi:hypothetical protein